MLERKLRQIDWKKTDSENFSDLLAEGFADRNIEYLPGGLVLKKPILVNDKYGSSEIHIIGIPFKDVFGQTRLRYHRIKLSEFEAVYTQILGNETSPIRMEIEGDDNKILNDTKKILSKRLSILPQRFVLEQVEKKRIGRDRLRYKYRFYFSIPETDFTDKTRGLSIINDKDVFVYVESPNIKIKNGQGVIPIDDTLSTVYESSSSVFVRDPYSSYSDAFPKEYKLVDITIGEDFGLNPINQILYKSPGGKFKGRISEDLKADFSEISVTGDSKYKDGVVESRIRISEPSTLTVKTKFGGEFRSTLADQIPEYRGPNVIDPLKTLYKESSASINTSIVSLDPKQEWREYRDYLTTLGAQSSSSINTTISSIDYKKQRQEIQEQLTTLMLQSSSSVSVTITSGGQ